MITKKNQQDREIWLTHKIKIKLEMLPAMWNKLCERVSTMNSVETEIYRHTKFA